MLFLMAPGEELFLPLRTPAIPGVLRLVQASLQSRICLLPVSSYPLPFVCRLYIQFSFLLKNTSHSGLGPSLIMSF